MDLLVKLYNLPEPGPVQKKLEKRGVLVRRALAPEKTVVTSWVRTMFSNAWADECEVTFGRSPITTFIAINGTALLGFACYDAICKNFFGPTGVDSDYRKGGVGKALLLSALSAMAADGYAYAIIGGVGPVDYYKKTVNALEIPKSTPGIYRGMLG
jgi:hypothetical protein